MTERHLSLPVTASAPGKLVLSGEYAVLDGAPAICMALDRRAHVSVRPGGDNHHTVTAPGFTDACGEFRALDDELEWLAAGDEFSLLDAVWRAGNVIPPGTLSLLLDTNEFVDARQGVKIGIGSSAALATALATALCDVAEAVADATRVAFAAHRRFQGGLGSGVDVACSSAGGLIEYRMGGASIEQLQWPDGLAYALLWSGVTASTGVRLERLDAQTARPSRAALVCASRRMAAAWRGGAVSAILDEYRDYTKVLREFSADHNLGIFDAGHAELMELAEATGLVYKPCGAGGGDVGIILTDSEESIAAFAEQTLPQQFEFLNAKLDPHGVRVDRDEP